jgi:hypothetical protein
VPNFTGLVPVSPFLSGSCRSSKSLRGGPRARQFMQYSQEVAEAVAVPELAVLLATCSWGLLPPPLLPAHFSDDRSQGSVGFAGHLK